MMNALFDCSSRSNLKKLEIKQRKNFQRAPILDHDVVEQQMEAACRRRQVYLYTSAVAGHCALCVTTPCVSDCPLQFERCDLPFYRVSDGCATVTRLPSLIPGTQNHRLSPQWRERSVNREIEISKTPSRHSDARKGSYVEQRSVCSDRVRIRSRDGPPGGAASHLWRSGDASFNLRNLDCLTGILIDEKIPNGGNNFCKTKKVENQRSKSLLQQKTPRKITAESRPSVMSPGRRLKLLKQPVSQESKATRNDPLPSSGVSLGTGVMQKPDCKLDLALKDCQTLNLTTEMNQNEPMFPECNRNLNGMPEISVQAFDSCENWSTISCQQHHVDSSSQSVPSDQVPAMPCQYDASSAKALFRTGYRNELRNRRSMTRRNASLMRQCCLLPVHCGGEGVCSLCTLTEAPSNASRSFPKLEKNTLWRQHRWQKTMMQSLPLEYEFLKRFCSSFLSNRYLPFGSYHFLFSRWPETFLKTCHLGLLIYV